MLDILAHPNGKLNNRPNRDGRLTRMGGERMVYSEMELKSGILAK